ncbi:MAG: TonB-dependent receptor, partial [Chitinophagaceae bacterium]|nr:TonB-dependent receptor [Chitinophagaceae bacterium]
MGKKILTLIAFGAALNAVAQKDTLSGKPLDEVVVTANKIEQKQSTTGKVVTVIGKEELQRSSGKTVGQVLNEQAGIWVNGSMQTLGSVQTVFMRGANAGRTLILMDGIPVNDASQITGDFDLNLFAINDVERIEICKGAQSTLYGSDAIAGVINIITIKKDITKPVNVKATVVVGNQNTNKTNLQLYGKTGKLTYATRFSKLRTDGFSSALDTTGTKNFDNDGYNGDVVNASLKYQATDHLSLRTFVQNSQYKADVDAGAFSDKRNYFIKNKGLNTGAGFNYQKNSIALIGNYQYGEIKRLYDDNASYP